MRISKPSGGDIPEPFNENDVMVFNAHIAKFLCQADIFIRKVFLQMLIEKRIKSLGGYPIQGIKEALNNIDSPINHLVHHCLKLLTNMNLATPINGDTEDPSYTATLRLRALCPRIQQYDMPFVEGLVKELFRIETEIKLDNSYRSIIDLLNKLKTGQRVRKDQASLNDDSLNKLVQLGVINISLNNMLSISNIGKVLLL